MKLSLLAFNLALVASLHTHALRSKDGQVFLDSLEDYNTCQSRDYTGEFCQDALKRWVSANPDDVFKAGKLTRLKMNSWGAIPFFTQAFDRKKGDCKDEDVKLAVLSAVALPGDSHKDVVAQARKIGFELCYEQMKTELMNEASIGSYAFTNTCKDLAAKGALKGLKAKKCTEIK